MTGFARPELAAEAIALAILAALALFAGRALAQRRSARLLGLAALAPGAGLRDGLLFLAVGAVALALPGLRAGEHDIRVPATGADVVLLFDVSRSMSARDVPPSRLERARALGDAVLAGLAAGDRAALAAFAGHGVLLTPLTPDSDALRALLPALDDSLLVEGGSRLEGGVRAAVGAFRQGSLRPRVVLLLSDGEDPEGGADAGSVAAAGARIVAVSFGSEAGAAVPYQNGPLRDANGRPVVSRADPERLRALAEPTGGVLFVADAFGSVDTQAVIDAVRLHAGRGGEELVTRRVPRSAVPALAALALAALLVETLAGRRPVARTGTLFAPGAPGRRRAGALATLAAAALFGLGAGGAAEEPGVADLEQQLRGAPEDSAALLRLGVARAREGSLAEAEHAFFAAAVRAREPGDAADAYYDLGVAALARRDLEAASAAFFDAIALNQGDRRAKFNLEWTLRALASQPPPADRPGAQEPTDSKPGDEGDPGGEPEPDREEPGEERETEAPRPAAEPSATRESAEPRENPVQLDPDAARRWLEGVADDPARALQSAARGREREGPAETRGAGPRW